MGLEGPCHGWLLSRSLRAPLRNARVSSWQSLWFQPEELTQGRSSECPMASLRSHAVTVPEVLTGQRPATTRVGGPDAGRWRTTGCLESWHHGEPRAVHRPFLLWQSLLYVGVADACALSLQSCATLCSPMGSRPPGSSVHRICQARILVWVAMPSSRWSSWPKDGIYVSWLSWRVPKSHQGNYLVRYCKKKKKCVFLFNVLLLIRPIGF